MKFNLKLSPLEEKPEIIDLISAKNRDISSEQMLEDCKSVFVKVQLALMHNDIKTLRNYETDELYAMHSLKIENNTCSVTDAPGSVSVQNAVFDDYQNDGIYEMLTVLIDAIVSQMTGDIMSGMNMETSKCRYRLAFKKSLIKVVTISEGAITECPSCGAPVDFSRELRCPYCNTTFSVADGEDSQSLKLCGFDNITPRSIIHL